MIISSCCCVTANWGIPNRCDDFFCALLNAAYYPPKLKTSRYRLFLSRKKPSLTKAMSPLIIENILLSTKILI
jgi:hypothetical protein